MTAVVYRENEFLYAVLRVYPASHLSERGVVHMLSNTSPQVNPFNLLNLVSASGVLITGDRYYVDGNGVVSIWKSCSGLWLYEYCLLLDRRLLVS